MHMSLLPPLSLSFPPSLFLPSLCLSLSLYIYINPSLSDVLCPFLQQCDNLNLVCSSCCRAPPHPPILMMLVGASGPRSKKTTTTKKHAVWFNIDIRGRGGKLQPKGAQGKYQVKYIRWWQDFYIVFLRSHYDGKEAA
jgi:hypothetical protein